MRSGFDELLNWANKLLPLAAYVSGICFFIMDQPLYGFLAGILGALWSLENALLTHGSDTPKGGSNGEGTNYC